MKPTNRQEVYDRIEDAMNIIKHDLEQTYTEKTRDKDRIWYVNQLRSECFKIANLCRYLEKDWRDWYRQKDKKEQKPVVLPKDIIVSVAMTIKESEPAKIPVTETKD